MTFYNKFRDVNYLDSYEQHPDVYIADANPGGPAVIGESMSPTSEGPYTEYHVPNIGYGTMDGGTFRL